MRSINETLEMADSDKDLATLNDIIWLADGQMLLMIGTLEMIDSAKGFISLVSIISLASGSMISM